MTTKLQNIPYQVFDHIGNCIDHINTLCVPSILLDTPYLSAIENSLGNVMDFRYIIFFEQGDPIGFSYCQVHPFSAKESIKSFREGQCSQSFVKAVLAHWVDFTALVPGNLLLTGQCGYYFKPEHQRNAISILNSAWIDLFEIEQKKLNASILFVKDFPDDSCTTEIDFLRNSEFFQFKVQPSMVLEINSRWQEFSDYLSALKSKYRIRVKQARKRGERLETRNITLGDLEMNSNQFQALLNNVLEESDFRIVNFDVNYLIEVKRQMPHSFKIRGYFLNETLVGFMTFFIQNEKMLAHFTGFDVLQNKQIDLYLNMLLDLVDQAIIFRLSEVDFSRTALEIKSSIGAVPRPMTNFIRHRSRARHKLLPNIFSTLYTPDDWVQRRPFRSFGL